MFTKSVVQRFVCLAFLLSTTSVSWATSGFFQSPQIVEWGRTSVAVADVNGDGKLDLVVGNDEWAGASCDYGVIVGVLIGNGDGTFQTPLRYCASGGGFMYISVADVNSDGRLDLILANDCFSVSDCDTAGIAVLLGNGDKTFQPAQTYRSGGGFAQFVLVADFNGDANPDVVVAHYCKIGEDCEEPPLGKATGNVGVLLGNGDGIFQPEVTYDSGGTIAASVAVADVNRDGKADLIVANRCVEDDCSRGVLGLLLGNGDGTFQPAVIFGEGEQGQGLFLSMAVADVNGDGAIDILVGVYWNVRVLLGNGNGTFWYAAKYATGGEEAWTIAIGDVNGDSVFDLLVGSRCDSSIGCPHSVVGVLRGNGDGTFRAPRLYGSHGAVIESLALGDVNGDRRLDLLVGNRCAHHTHCSHGATVLFLNASYFPTTTGLTSSVNPSKHGHAVILTATVTPSGPTGPTGRVKFWDGTTALGAGQVSGGVATLATSKLAPGTHPITAQYFGDTTNGKSKSLVVKQVVQ